MDEKRNDARHNCVDSPCVPGEQMEPVPGPAPLKLRIDTRYSRFYIHKQTLKAIGDPEFIHWGYQPKTKTLMLLGTWVDERNAIRLRFTKGGSCFVHSKALVEGIRRVSGVLTGEHSYLLAGKLEGSMPAVSFCLEEAKVVPEGKGAQDPQDEEDF